VVNFVLKKRFVRVEEMEVEVGEEGLTKFCEKRFHADLRKTRRIYPHVHNMDGFYVAKLVKVAKGKRQSEPADQSQ
jgi:ribosomal RNA methyltransferase Nop2